MRVDGQILQSVAFLCLNREVDGAESVVPFATCFFVRLYEHDFPWKYVVTARHVIEEAERSEILVRMNLRSGGFQEKRSTKDDWYCHNNADVAVLPFGTPTLRPKEVEHISILESTFVNANWAYDGPPLSGGVSFPVALGDEIAFVSLFAQHAGIQKNLPIVRFGNISRMPIEPIRFSRFAGTSSFNAQAYLAECRSWGGHSGAPVFWTQTPAIKWADPETGNRQRQPVNLTGLLGLVSAHFDAKVETSVTGDFVGRAETPVNSGMAAVTPASCISELLHSEDLQEHRMNEITKTEKDK